MLTRDDLKMATPSVFIRRDMFAGLDRNVACCWYPNHHIHPPELLHQHEKNAAEGHSINLDLQIIHKDFTSMHPCNLNYNRFTTPLVLLFSHPRLPHNCEAVWRILWPHEQYQCSLSCSSGKTSIKNCFRARMVLGTLAFTGRCAASRCNNSEKAFVDKLSDSKLEDEQGESVKCGVQNNGIAE